MVRDWVITPLTFGVGGIAKEDTREGSWCEFAGGSGCGVGIAEAPKNAKTVIGWMHTKDKVMRCVVPTRTTRADVKVEDGGGESIRPKPGGGGR